MTDVLRTLAVWLIRVWRFARVEPPPAAPPPPPAPAVSAPPPPAPAAVGEGISLDTMRRCIAISAVMIAVCVLENILSTPRR